MPVSTFSNSYGSYSPINFSNQFVNTAKNPPAKPVGETYPGYSPASFSQQFVQKAKTPPMSNKDFYSSPTPVGGYTPNNGGFSVGYSGSGEHPEITGESTPGIYNSGSFGSAATPDLSNSVKVGDWFRFMQEQGYDTSGLDSKKLQHLSGNAGFQEYIQSGLKMAGSNSQGATTQATQFGGGASGGIGASGSWDTAQPSTMESLVRKLQTGASTVGKNVVSGIEGAIGRAIKPTSSAYAVGEGGVPSTTSQSQGGLGGFLESIKRRVELSRPKGASPISGGVRGFLGNVTDVLGQILSLPEMGLSEGLAGGYTGGTRIVPTSVERFGNLPVVKPTGNFDIQNLLGTQDQTVPEIPPAVTPSFNDGSNYGFQNAEVGNFLNKLISSYASMGAEQSAMVDTSSMDAWYQQALQQSGMTEQQAGLETINQQIQVVADLLDNLDKDITEESKNFLMTEGQRRRLVETRGKPLRDELAKLVAGASKYGVNIKNTLAMLEQQIGMKRDEVKMRLEAQKSVQANKQAGLKGLTSLLPYMTPTAGQQLSSQTQKDIATMKNEGGGSIADLLAG